MMNAVIRDREWSRAPQREKEQEDPKEDTTTTMYYNKTTNIRRK